MPLGFERLNERTQRPNPNINFIKPLSGPHKTLAKDFLERIAAISLPIMRKNHIYVMALEEFPPNREFVGRNFNAGEVIQLVLKSVGTGQWLSFRSVQMVMMHELAHCKQMNHSGFFWKVRDEYALMLRELWGKGYSGEGVWGRGQTLLSGQYREGVAPEAMGEVRDLCGGTYKSRRGKRKRVSKEKEKVGYAERQQRRILKKFGKGGQAVGEDESIKAKLEGGKKLAKPRVAKSARGRELRAAAALARFEQAKQEETKIIKIEDDSETESDYEEIDDSTEAARDVDGKKMTDGRGHGMVKVCEDEDAKDGNARREMDELLQVDIRDYFKTPLVKFVQKNAGEKESAVREEGISTASEDEDDGQGSPALIEPPPKVTSLPRTSTKAASSRLIDSNHTTLVPRSPATKTHSSPAASSGSSDTCRICSFQNEPRALTCVVCANVVDPAKLPNHWRCGSLACRESGYVNSNDVGRCGACAVIKKAKTIH